MYWPEGETLEETAARLAEMVRAREMIGRWRLRAEVDNRRHWVNVNMWLEDHDPDPDPGAIYPDPTKLSPELQAQKERNNYRRQQHGLDPI